MSAPVVVVGTGRCGSTLISEMMRAHPRVLSVSEFFSFITDLGALIPEAFPTAPLTGAEFWRILAGCHPRQNLLLRHGLRMDEVLFPPPERRDLIEAGVPALLLTTLPHLSDDPEALFAALEAEIRTWPEAPVGDHYRALFADLQRRLDRAIWVERSGGTLRIAHRLRETFPEARFVHVVRDGRNTAISMSRHVGFRMALIHFQLLELLGVDPFRDDDRSELEDLSDELAALLPEEFSAKAFWSYDLAPSICGHYWAGEVRDGLAALASLAPERLLTICYEELLERPRETVTRLGAFLDLGAPDPRWIAASTAMIGQGRSDWRALPDRARRDLDEACAPGFAALADAGIGDYT
ncbi:MAG: sulfotransferase [Myxococcales bacterium]|nr:sulfotransferase [Myxococcales bacterium]